MGGEMALGQILVNARKVAGISLEDLSKRTNIRESLLREFEADKCINAGGDTYARGHLRTIARVMGIDPEPLIAAFDEEHAHERRPIHDQLVESNVTLGIPEKSKITYKQLIALSLVGIVAVFGISFIVNSTGSGSNSTGQSSKPSASASPTASAAPSASESQNSEVKTYSSGSDVQVKLEAINGSSWLFVSDAAGITLYSGRATQGETFLFSSTETVNLRVGNAGAVKLTVNGKEVPPIGVDGEVVNLSYGVNS